MAHRSTGSTPLRNVLASRIRLVGWDAGRTLITKIELRERCLTDYELIVLAKALSISLDELTRGAYKEALELARTDDNPSP